MKDSKNDNVNEVRIVGKLLFDSKPAKLSKNNHKYLVNYVRVEGVNRNINIRIKAWNEDCDKLEKLKANDLVLVNGRISNDSYKPENSNEFVDYYYVNVLGIELFKNKKSLETNKEPQKASEKERD